MDPDRTARILLKENVYHALIQNILSGGGGVQAQQPGQRCFFFSPQLIIQRGSNDFISEKTILFQGSRGVQHFPRGGGGV